MVELSSLIVAIATASVAVFFTSFLVHMILKYHTADYRGLPNEDEVRAALASSAKSPGQYFIPHCTDHRQLQEPAIRQKFIDGPVALITMRPPGPPTMGKALGQWFVLIVVVTAVAAYLTSKTVLHGASFLAVARSVSLITLLAYGVGSVTQAVWAGKPWAVVFRDLIDAFLYALATACVFGWMWPR